MRYFALLCAFFIVTTMHGLAGGLSVDSVSPESFPPVPYWCAELVYEKLIKGSKELSKGLKARKLDRAGVCLWKGRLEKFEPIQSAKQVKDQSFSQIRVYGKDCDSAVPGSRIVGIVGGIYKTSPTPSQQGTLLKATPAYTGCACPERTTGRTLPVPEECSLEPDTK